MLSASGNRSRVVDDVSFPILRTVMHRVYIDRVFASILNLPFFHFSAYNVFHIVNRTFIIVRHRACVLQKSAKASSKIFIWEINAIAFDLQELAKVYSTCKFLSNMQWKWNKFLFRNEFRQDVIFMEYYI